MTQFLSLFVWSLQCRSKLNMSAQVFLQLAAGTVSSAKCSWEASAASTPWTLPNALEDNCCGPCASNLFKFGTSTYVEICRNMSKWNRSVFSKKKHKASQNLLTICWRYLSKTQLWHQLPATAGPRGYRRSSSSWDTSHSSNLMQSASASIAKSQTSSQFCELNLRNFQYLT